MKKSLVVFIIAALAVVGIAGYIQANELIGKGKTIAFVPKQLGNPYFVAVKDAVEEAAAAYGFDFRVNAPDSSIEVDKQIAIVEAFIGAGVDVLILIPNDATAIVDVINEAARQGIAVFLVDSGADESDYISYIGTDNYAGGVMAAHWFGENVKGKVAIIDGAAGNAATTARYMGFMDTIGQYPHIQVVTSDYGNGDMGTAMAVAENFLIAYPDLAAIFACDDIMAKGAGTAVDAARRDVIVVGFDGSPDGAQAILDGLMDASIAQQPRLMGKMAVEAAVKYLQGEEVERVIYTDCEIVDKDNAHLYLEWH
ncbi:MAG: sugar ABC transporter substrate-binding protein [Firmicutes bacterium]|nr:sugar ABC transporter substrate-binding protein [Bacillota bacterium]